eukprot:g862.t1
MAEMIMEVPYTREQFGKHCYFEERPARILESVSCLDVYDQEYVAQNPIVKEFDTVPLMSEHSVNTDRFETKSSGMIHREGGWPKDVDPDEPSDVNRFRKKVEKDEDFRTTVKCLGPVVDKCVRQNNTIDIYEEYFEGAMVDHSSEPPSAKTLAVFRDPSPIKRTATSIDWHPDMQGGGGGSTGRIAVSYSILNFQDPRFLTERMPIKV